MDGRQKCTCLSGTAIEHCPWHGALEGTDRLIVQLGVALAENERLRRNASKPMGTPLPDRE